MFTFKWDGTELQNFGENNIIEKITSYIFEYWVIRYQECQTIVLVRKTKCYTPCLVDELKPLFGLQKLGTHYAKYGSGYVILIRSRTDLTGRNIIIESTLNNIKNIKELNNDKIKDKDKLGSFSVTTEKDNLINEIKRIYVFRDLLCLSKSTDNCIAIRRTESNELTAICFIDSAINPRKLMDLTRSTYLPDVAFNRWFHPEESPSQILCRMCKIYKKAGLTHRVFNLRLSIEKITNQVCGNYLENLPGILCDRLSSKLQYHLNKK